MRVHSSLKAAAATARDLGKSFREREHVHRAETRVQFRERIHLHLGEGIERRPGHAVVGFDDQLLGAGHRASGHGKGVGSIAVVQEYWLPILLMAVIFVVGALGSALLNLPDRIDSTRLVVVAALAGSAVGLLLPERGGSEVSR